MKRKGYVLVITLIIISILLILAASILKIGANRANSLKNLEDYAQAEYIPESIVNIIFGEYIDELEKFYEDNYGSLREQMELPFDFSSYFDADITAKIRRDPAFNYNKFLIKVTSNYKGITTRCTASGEDINNIYLDKNGISLENPDNLNIFKFYEPSIFTTFHIKNDSKIELDGNDIVIKDVESGQIEERFSKYKVVSIINESKLIFQDSINIFGIFINNGDIENEFDFNLTGFLVDFSDKSQNITVRGSAAYYNKPKKLIYNFNEVKKLRIDLPKYFNFRLEKITTSDLVN